MNDPHGITAENLLRTLPIALQPDESMQPLAAVAAEALACRPEEIRRLLIYSNIDELEEDLLDILAHDFKVDWWDPEYTVEQKRQTLKDSWLVHKRLGTRWAVTTALGTVFPGASILEWFQYGGTPYCFRIDIPLPEEGVTEEKQCRAVSRIWYYKNLRSHLESVNIQAESTGLLRVGACTMASATIEVWPELVSGVEITGSAALGALTAVREAVNICPELVTKLEATGRVGTSAGTAVRQFAAVSPELTARVDANMQAGASGITAAHQTVEIYPG